MDRAAQRLGQRAHLGFHPGGQLVHDGAGDDVVLGKSGGDGYSVRTVERATLTAEKARVAGNAGVKRDRVARLDVGHGLPNRYYRAAGFVAQHLGWRVQAAAPVEQVQVGGAHAAADDVYGDVGWPEPRQWAVFEAQIVRAVPHRGEGRRRQLVFNQHVWLLCCNEST